MLRTHKCLYCLDFPEITGTAFIVPTSTVGAAQSTLTPSSSASNLSSTSTSHSSSKSGAIAGGVVGGIVAGAAIIVGVVAWFVVRRRHARSTPSNTHMSGQGGEMLGQPVSYPLSIGTPRIYVSDPLFPLPNYVGRELQLIWSCALPRTLRIQRHTRAKSTFQ